MEDWAIKVKGLSKKYNIVHKSRNQDDTLISAFAGGLRSLFSGSARQSKEEFWALRDIDFTVKQGDRVGIIGRNGAGKSTLLKILSRVVKPSAGRIEYNGRMASLLEVGTGFHGDLTGRENIYLNGTILGMNRREIDRKFDEIVAFSEIEQFLDTPVKRYSSGMYVRLAFAVAAHLDPDILIVDEVLAVGDSAFQKKCMNRMTEISGEGRTLFFVSHNMAAVQHLCNTCIYMKGGELMMYGPTQEVITAYLKSGREAASGDLGDRKDRIGNGSVKFISTRLRNEQGQNLLAGQSGNPLFLETTVEIPAAVSNVVVSVGIDNDSGQRVAHCSNETTNQNFNTLQSGTQKITVCFPKLPFAPGLYSFTLFATAGGEIADWVQDAGSLSVEAGDFYNSGKLPPEGQASVYIEHSFLLD